MIVQLEIERDDLTPWTRAMARKLASKRQMNAAVAQAVAVPIQQNFLSLSSSNRNPFGAKSTFWGLMNAGTKPGADDESGWVAMPEPVALRYFGGTVVPGPGKERLAIPARSEAYGKSPRDFSDLRLAFFGGKTLALVQADQQKVKYGRRRKDGSRGPTSGGTVSGGAVYFWLVPSATIQPDPSVLPTPEVLSASGVEGLRGYLSHLDGRKRDEQGRFTS